MPGILSENFLSEEIKAVLGRRVGETLPPEVADLFPERVRDGVWREPPMAVYMEMEGLLVGKDDAVTVNLDVMSRLVSSAIRDESGKRVLTEQDVRDLPASQLTALFTRAVVLLQMARAVAGALTPVVRGVGEGAADEGKPDSSSR